VITRAELPERAWYLLDLTRTELNEVAEGWSLKHAPSEYNTKADLIRAIVFGEDDHGEESEP
jgi:hypothetical protein